MFPTLFQLCRLGMNSVLIFKSIPVEAVSTISSNGGFKASLFRNNLNSPNDSLVLYCSYFKSSKLTSASKVLTGRENV